MRRYLAAFPPSSTLPDASHLDSGLAILHSTGSDCPKALLFLLLELPDSSARASYPAEREDEYEATESYQSCEGVLFPTAAEVIRLTTAKWAIFRADFCEDAWSLVLT